MNLVNLKKLEIYLEKVNQLTLSNNQLPKLEELILEINNINQLKIELNKLNSFEISKIKEYNSI